ncbi:MAG: coproporphyrinogen III oxidase family protein [bacterium]|nr:coproporphyrinogen III oxidase family protein [bacterium]
MTTGQDRSCRGGGLYVHVPFCASICSYCHFARTADHDRAARTAYVDGVLAELALRRESCGLLRDGGRRLGTAYLGGGTPSLLEPVLMERLVAGTVHTLDPAPDCEFTAEANPESLTADLAACWRDLGVNRISLGVQSLAPPVLKVLGRRCGPDTARRALALAGSVFPRVSADWILAPGIAVAALRDELTEAVDLGVEHISFYILEVHEGTPLAADLAAGKLRLPPDERTASLYLEAAAHLERLGLRQYEVSNFARPGTESRHNQGYWRGVPWLALGPAAHGCWGRRRYANLANPVAWRARLDADELPEAEVDLRDTAARRLERVVLALRTGDGVSLAWLPAGALDLAAGHREGLWETRAGRLVLTPRGFLRIDTVEEHLARSLA